MTIGLRYLDRFERRDSEWKIAHRVLGWDWNRIDVAVQTTDPGPEMIQGKRNRDDMVYGSMNSRRRVYSLAWLSVLFAGNSKASSSSPRERGFTSSE